MNMVARKLLVVAHLSRPPALIFLRPFIAARLTETVTGQPKLEK